MRHLIFALFILVSACAANQSRQCDVFGCPPNYDVVPPNRIFHISLPVSEPSEAFDLVAKAFVAARFQLSAKRRAPAGKLFAWFENSAGTEVGIIGSPCNLGLMVYISASTETTVATQEALNIETQFVQSLTQLLGQPPLVASDADALTKPCKRRAKTHALEHQR